MQQFQHAMTLFGTLGQQVTTWERTLPPEEARRNTERLFVHLTDSDFEMIADLVELIETEPGKRLFGLSSAGFRQHLLEMRVIRDARSANAGKPLTETERCGERQKQEEE